MRVLLTTIGSQGDVRPLVALASQLRESGHGAHLCVSPDLRDWVEGLGFPFTPIGPQMRGMVGAPVTKPAGSAPPPSPEQMRGQVEATLARESATLTEAARGCDVIVAAAGRPLIPARSVAETLGIRYVFAVFSPSHLPSPHHAPFGVRGASQDQAPSAAGNLELWDRHGRQLNDRLRTGLNRHRAAAGLSPIDDVRDHIFTGRPWLAADPVLAPWPGAAGEVFQTGAWILPDQRPLAPELEAFLAAGDPPVYFGFGSMRMQPQVAQVVAESARRVGRRAIIAGGWAGLNLTAADPGLLVIGEVNQQVLFRRVAAVVHHGGAGTTTAAALAGAPQVIVAQAFDQPYWARRITHLGIGAAHPGAVPTADSLTAALGRALDPAAAARARVVTFGLDARGAQAAADSLIDNLENRPADDRMDDGSAADACDVRNAA